MIKTKSFQESSQRQLLKEKMIEDAILILASVEWLQTKTEEKLLEIDAVQDYNKALSLGKDILFLLGGLSREEQRMDEYMAKYKRLINEKEALLPGTCKKKSVYLRGVSPNKRRTCESS